MNKYEKLLEQAKKDKISIDENYEFSSELSGLYVDGNIALSNKLTTTADKACVLAEELGHHYTSFGDILDLTKSENKKQERQARLWAYNQQIGLRNLVKAYEHGCKTRYEIAEYLEVPESFLEEAITSYCAKYGTCTVWENYYIIFIPYLAIGKTL